MTALAPVSAAARPRVSYRPGRVMRRFLADRVGVTALVVVLILVVIALVSRFWTPVDPTAQELLDRLEGPSSAHWLGTDNVGRDILSRLMRATWTALTSCALAVGLAVAVGVPLGLLAGYAEGFLDGLLGRISDVLMSLPPLLFAVAIVGALGPSLTNAMIAIGVLLMPRFFRLTRISTREVKNEDFVEAARASGTTTMRILGRHVLPNIASPLLIQISFGAAVAIVSESGLSFLGLGAQAPTASWGSMVKEGFDRLAENSWSMYPPAIMIVVTVLVLSLLGDGLRDAVGRQTGGRR
ncbi:ABC transporter permease [Pseudonocardia kunmingensis]|uniref:Peptide/nickel transport system permease protein n=1 Tax=Pseudonocardia kunmingensis TaxID=630975 RepID=A0A543DPP2_9PSEU|nr:ABC transporter permease [Pseudonocardia kunmingensis]TQM11312.1 peptide/nickel transport system permease protein [Pseudonocardia kunmingensis]